MIVWSFEYVKVNEKYFHWIRFYAMILMNVLDNPNDDVL